MAVTQQETICRYLGNGTLKVFPYTFKIFESSQLKVYIDGVEKYETAEYTVSGVGNSGGGNVTFTIAPADAATVVVMRTSTVERTLDFMDGGVISGDILDYDQDYQTQLIQDLSSRSLRIEGDYSYDAKGARIKNIGEAVLANDAVTKAYADTILDQTNSAVAQAEQAASQAEASVFLAENHSLTAQSAASSVVQMANEAAQSAIAAEGFANDAELSSANAASAASTYGAAAGAAAGEAAAIDAVVPYVSQAQVHASDAEASAGTAANAVTAALGHASAAEGFANAASASATAASNALATVQAIPFPSRSAIGTSTTSTLTVTGIPPGVRHLTIRCIGLVTSAGAEMTLQLGSGSLATTGYVTYQTNITTSVAVAGSTPTNGWLVGYASQPTAYNGVVSLAFINSNLWAGDGRTTTLANRITFCSGYKEMPGEIDQIALTLSAGTFTGDGFVIVEWDSWNNLGL